MQNLEELIDALKSAEKIIRLDAIYFRAWGRYSRADQREREAVRLHRLITKESGGEYVNRNTAIQNTGAINVNAQ